MDTPTLVILARVVQCTSRMHSIHTTTRVLASNKYYAYYESS